MLVLTRRINENLVIGDDVTITVLGVSGKQVRLGVTAPREISVHREEIYNKIQLNKNMDNQMVNAVNGNMIIQCFAISMTGNSMK